MIRIVSMHTGIIEKIQSPEETAIQNQSSQKMETAASDFSSGFNDGCGANRRRFRFGGFGMQKEGPMMQNEHLTQTPDTLDLVTRARYAINAITRSTNPEAEYAVYFTGILHRNPPTLLREIRCMANSWKDWR